MSNLKGIEDGRAEYAFKKVTEAKEKLSGDKAKEYKAYVKKIPMLIKTNGLAATFAFAFSKAKRKTDNAYGLIYYQTAQWFIKHRSYLLPDFHDQNEFVYTLTQLKSPQYRAATNEVIALFNWLRRFADGQIEGEATNIND